MCVLYITKYVGTAAYVPVTQNNEAGSYFRNFNEAIEWILSTQLFQKISNIFGNPTLDFFASQINYQIDKYISWKTDPKTIAIDAFSIKWNTEFYYIFSSFSLLG